MIWRILDLLSKCCPSAVVWAVIAIAVYTVNAVVPAWARPHVGEEGFKRMPPSLTHRDTPTSVAMPVLSPRIGTSSLHCCPALIFRRWSPSGPCVAVFCNAVQMKTTAALMFVHSEIASANLSDDFAAITATPPCRFSVKRSVTFQDQKSCEPFARNVDKGWHPTGIIRLSAIRSQGNFR